jgi:hypothetical protein
MEAATPIDAQHAVVGTGNENKRCSFGSRIRLAKRVYLDVQKCFGNYAWTVFPTASV